MNNPPLGVMQGRLLPQYQGRYQAHPRGYWQNEFPIAATHGLDQIEFILDFEAAWENPLLAAPDQIAALAAETGVAVQSVCADYFMDAPLHSPIKATVDESLRVLRALVKAAGSMGITDIVIPCVDQSRLGTDADRDRLVSVIESFLAESEDSKVNLALETDLPPAAFAKLLDRLNHKRITVNYDIGNSASLGYDPTEEFAAYGHRISDIHIKDRVRGGGSVLLGSGNADIPAVFDLIFKYELRVPLIIQAYRDEQGINVFQSQLSWLRKAIEPKLLTTH